mgnify:CR=1 FL=1
MAILQQRRLFLAFLGPSSLSCQTALSCTGHATGPLASETSKLRGWSEKPIKSPALYQKLAPKPHFFRKRKRCLQNGLKKNIVFKMAILQQRRLLWAFLGPSSLSCQTALSCTGHAAGPLASETSKLRGWSEKPIKSPALYQKLAPKPHF